jgi:outer membrane protein OmpA-like peptidoglycan-associated protein
VILHPDARLNLADIAKRERGAAPQSITTPEPAASAATAPKPNPAAPPTGPVLNLRWQGVALRDGSVFFTDNFIKPNYSARLTQLKGELSALSSAAPEPARLSLTGALDDGAPLRIAGRVHPLGARLSTDIEASARGIALTRMSTYAERYAGYAIEKGSMSVNVRYQIEQGKLQAENQLFLDQLTFGDKVDSPDATSLPVRLAVALLKDRNGVIDIRMPVSGTLDDPQFSVGGVIWKVVVNLIEKAVTAPFAMLFGGDSNEASALAFAPGSAELDAAARERLDALAQRLIDKPGLKLEATGRADPALDGAAIQAAHIEAMKAEAMKAPAAAASAPASASAQASAASSAASSATSAPVPTLEPAALERALRTLADARGDRVLAYLAAKLPADRILLNRSQLTAERASGDTGPTTRVQFELR